MTRLDWILLAICFGCAWPMPDLDETCFHVLEEYFARIAGQKWISLAVIGALTILARLTLLPWMPVPQPKIHDEFSYLLAADTFAHGRLVNPPHPLWIFFDTFHVLHHPTYASMYPPAQGSVLAIGHLLGLPWIGVLLSTAAMCVAIVWMLQGWMPPQWALLGGVLVLSRLGLFSYWINSYWGGSVAMTGAALILGALPRIMEFRRFRDAIISGVGAAMLATSRPVEGFTFCVPLAIALLWWTLPRDARERRQRMTHILLPVAAMVACTGGFVGYYNFRVTGSPLVFPHFIEQRANYTTPVFLWQHEKPPISYSNPQFDDFYHNFMPSLYHTSWPDAEGQLTWKAGEFWQFFLGPALSIPFLALPWLLGDGRVRLLLCQMALSALGLWIVVWYHAHYAAPIAATLYLLLMLSMRRMRKWNFLGHAIGVGLSRLVVLFSLAIGPVYFLHSILPASGPIRDWFHRHFLLVLVITLSVLAVLRMASLLAAKPSARSRSISSLEFLILAALVIQICSIQKNLYPENYPFVDDLNEPFRKPVEQQLAAMPGQHLVLVRYSKTHNSGEEYVYNRADIDGAQTVWAREIPGMDLTPLFTYFRNRDVWLYEPDEDDSIVSPYTPPRAAP